jgi:hypothetical protein
MIITLYSVTGRLVRKNVNRFRIKWDGKSRSNLQFRVKQLLKPIWQGDIVFEEFPVFGCLLKVDIYNASKKIAVEANGPQHDKFNKFFHNGEQMNWVANISRDLKKYEWFERNGIKIVEYVEADLKDVPNFYVRLYA